MPNEIDDFSEWVGRTETVNDGIGLSTAKSAAATFDIDPDDFQLGTQLPPLWHWFYFLPKAPQSQLGSDGHPRREPNSFLPPIPLPRRMFAGARLKWHRPIVIGRPACRAAVIRDVSRKSGRSGELAFVTVAYRYFQPQMHSSAPDPAEADVFENREQDLCLEEEQDIVYREAGAEVSPPKSVVLPEAPPGAWSRVVEPDPRLLFRFSALTFNAHRIHYDRTYATGQEGYPGLVVHGPLTAMLLLQLVRDNTPQAIASFSFRSRSPLFDLAPFRLLAVRLENNRVELEAQGPDAQTAMIAEAECV